MSAIREERMSEENRGSLNSKKPSKAEISHTNDVSATASHNTSFAKHKVSENKKTLLKTLGLNLQSKILMVADSMDEAKSSSSCKGQEASTKIEETPEQALSHSQFRKGNITENSECASRDSGIQNIVNIGGSVKTTLKMPSSGILSRVIKAETKANIAKQPIPHVEKVISYLKLGSSSALQHILDKKKGQSVQFGISDSPTNGTAGQVLGLLTEQAMTISNRDLMQTKTNVQLSKVKKKPIAGSSHRRTHSDTYNFGLNSNNVMPVQSAKVNQPKLITSVMTSAREPREKVSNLFIKPEMTVNFNKKIQVANIKADAVKKSVLSTELVKELKKDNVLKNKQNNLLKEENQFLKQENLTYKTVPSTYLDA